MEQETERLKRINQLAEKAKTTGLTPAEIEERAVLRKEYLAAFRANMTAQMEQIYIMDADGNKKKVTKKTEPNPSN